MAYDSVTLFHAKHKNLGSAALGRAALAAGRVAMLKQPEPGSEDRLGIAPKSLLVPPELEETAVNLFRRSTENDRTFVQSLALDVLPVWYWTDATDWYLAADPLDIPCLEVGFSTVARSRNCSCRTVRRWAACSRTTRSPTRSAISTAASARSSRPLQGGGGIAAPRRWLGRDYLALIAAADSATMRESSAMPSARTRWRSPSCATARTARPPPARARPTMRKAPSRRPIARRCARSPRPCCTTQLAAYHAGDTASTIHADATDRNALSERYAGARRAGCARRYRELMGLGLAAPRASCRSRRRAETPHRGLTPWGPVPYRDRRGRRASPAPGRARRRPCPARRRASASRRWRAGPANARPARSTAPPRARLDRLEARLLARLATAGDR